MGSPWPALLVFFVANLVQGLATGQGVSLFTMIQLGVMIASLVVYVGLIGSTGSDPLSAAAGAIAIARSIALAAFVGSIVVIVIANFITLASPLILFLDIAIGGFAVFGAVSAAKPGAA